MSDDFESPSDSYYQEEGCCLTCEDAEPGCLCYNCNCSKCVHLVDHKCHPPKSEEYLTWHDYEYKAKRVQERSRAFYGKEPKNLVGVFSNGTIITEIFYCGVHAIPDRITYRPQNYTGSRTLLLQEIKEWKI